MGGGVRQVWGKDEKGGIIAQNSHRFILLRMYGKGLAISKQKMTALILNHQKTANVFEGDSFDVRKKNKLINSCYSFNIHTVFLDFQKGGNYTHAPCFL